MLAITRFRFGLVGALLLAAVPALAPPPAVAAPAPTVTRLSVHAGPTAGGVRVTITGRHLTPVRSVRFGSARATHVVVRSARKLVVTAPRHAAGLVDVRVVSAHGRSSARPADRFRYLAPPVVTRLSVSSGSVAGGSRVTVTGRNLSTSARSPSVTRPGPRCRCTHPRLSPSRHLLTRRAWSTSA